MRIITKSIYPAFTAPALALACFTLSVPAQAATAEPAKPDEATRARVSENYGKLPVSFEVNDGQQGRYVKFFSRGSGYNLFLATREAVLVLTKSEKPATPPANNATLSQKPKRRSTVLRTMLVDANPAAKVTGEERLPGKVNYFIGNDPSKWQNDVPTYGKVRYEQVYPGIDLVYYGNQRQLEYDFIVAPGADPTRIRLSVAGAQTMCLDGRGQLVVQTAIGAVRWNKPRIYQQIGGTRRAVKGKYVLRRGHEISFQVAAYDTAKPTLIYSTYLGGSGDDLGYRVSGDDAGNIYVTGYTSSTDFPTAAGAFQTTKNGGYDAFVAKVNPTGTGLLYSTYLGGSGDDFGKDIRVDSSGAYVYVTGTTSSTDFPTTAGAFQTVNKGGQDIFVTKLNAADGAVVYSTYLGGSGTDVGVSISVDTSGNAYVTGYTNSADFPVTGALQATRNGGYDAFVAKISPDGTSLVYSTYLGGNGDDFGQSIRVIGSGKFQVGAGTAYVTGYTNSTNFPTTSGAFQTNNNGGYDAFVTKITPDGTGLVYSTYLGGSDKDVGVGIEWNEDGNVYVTGYTESTDFPITLGAFQTTKKGGYDAFVTRFNSDGTAVLYSTYLGGSGDDYAQGFREDAGNAYITGNTDSTDFPTTANAFQATKNGGYDVFLTKFNPTGAVLLYSTYLGGSGDDFGQDIRVILTNAYVTGTTSSTDFPTTAGAFQTTNNGGQDGFVAKIDTGVDVMVQTSPAGLSFTVDGTTYSTTQEFSWVPGSSHTIATTTPQSGGTGARYAWIYWSDGGAISHTVTPTKNTTFTAKFATQYYLTMNAGTGGTVSPPSSWRTSGTTASITATPTNNTSVSYNFSGWTGSGTGSYSGTNNPASITMSGPITETAAFTQNPVNITVQTSLAGLSFTVDGASYTAAQTFSWAPGSSHTIGTTSPQSGATGVRYVWSNWTGGGAISHGIAPTTNKTYTATFTTQYYLTMSAGSGGTVSPSSGWRTSGSTFSISATASAGYSFSNWTGSASGSYSGTDNPRSITMIGPITETATFTHN